MVEDNVEDNVYTLGMGLIDKIPELPVGQGRVLSGRIRVNAKPWFDAQKVEDAVTAPIPFKPGRIHEHRRQPDGTDTEIPQIR